MEPRWARRRTLPRLQMAVGTPVTDRLSPPALRSPLRRLVRGGDDGDRLTPYAPLVLAALGIVAWALSVGHLHPYTAGAFGLVTHLPALWWTGLLLVTGAMVLALVPARPRAVVVLGSLVAFALVLHGTLPAAESTPRFEAAYTIAGFAQYIAQHGHTLPRIDARMSWYGMLSGDGMASMAMGVPTMWFLRWAPLVFELIYLFPVKALANMSLRSPRARWAVLPIFLAGNWIDQDYFSPQAIGLLIYLVVAVVAVRTFAGRGLQPWPVNRLMGARWVARARTRVLRWLYVPLDAEPAEAPPEPSTARHRTAFELLLFFLVAVLVITHEISPVALCIVLFFLALTGRTRLRTLWLFTAFAVFAWLSWAAQPFWSGHLAKIFGGIGNVTSTFTSSVSNRAVSTSLGRSVVEASRLVAAGLTWLLAGIGTWVMWRRRRSQWTLVVLAVAPVAVGGAVSYGGEVALRILLFSMAPLAVLAAGLIDGPHLRPKAVAALVLGALALVVLFPVARYGNESFEAMPAGDIAAANWIYSHVPVGSTVLVFARDEPLMYSHVGDYKTRELGVEVLGSVSDIESVLPHRSAWIYMTHAQMEDGIVFGGLPKNWLTVFERELGQMPFVHLAERTSTAQVYEISSRVHPVHRLVPPPKVHPAPPAAHPPKPPPPPVDRHLHQRPPAVHRTRPKSSRSGQHTGTHTTTTTTTTVPGGKVHTPPPSSSSSAGTAGSASTTTTTTTVPSGPPPSAP